MCIVGERDKEKKNITVRQRKGGNMGSFSVDTFSNMIKEMCKNKINQTI